MQGFFALASGGVSEGHLQVSCKLSIPENKLVHAVSQVRAPWWSRGKPGEALVNSTPLIPLTAALTPPMLRLLSSKAQGNKDF